jgi:hypothetical protein
MKDHVIKIDKKMLEELIKTKIKVNNVVGNYRRGK